MDANSLYNFIKWLKTKGYVIASETNDSESDQDLHECWYTDKLAQEYLNDNNYDKSCLITVFNLICLDTKTGKRYLKKIVHNDDTLLGLKIVCVDREIDPNTECEWCKSLLSRVI